jgi:limonene-1,2-epoxide hydrolase
MMVFLDFRKEEYLMRKVTIVLLLLCGGIFGCADKAAQQDAERIAVANDMIDAWNEMDWERVYDLFAEDGVLHSVMREPIVGREVIRTRLDTLFAGLERIELQITNIGAVNDVVMFERVDDFDYNGKHSRLPVVGVMEISNGKVDVWREYYDKASLMAALSSPAPQGASEDEIQALSTKLSSDWNAGNMAAYLDAYSDEAKMSLLFQNRIVASKPEMVEFFTTTWTDEEAMGDFGLDQVGIHLIATDTAIARGVFKHVFPNETVHGAFSHVWQKDAAGNWKIIHEHTSRGYVE